MRLARGGVGEDDHRELQPLGAVHGHDPHSLRPLLDHGRLARGAALGVGVEAVDEGPERGRALRLEAARQVEHAERVGERLLARRPDGDARVRARRREEPLQRVGDGPPVPPEVQLAEDRERVDHRRDAAVVVGRRRLERAERVQRAQGEALGGARGGRGRRGVAIGEERVVRQREEGAPQRRVQAELVVGPLDGGERVPHGLHLLAVVEGAASDEHVRDAPRLERAHVAAGEVVPEALEALEEQADVARVDADGLGGVPLGDLPPAVVDEPVDEGADRVGQRELDRDVGDLAPFAVRARHREGDDRGLVGDRRPVLLERDVARLRAGGVAGHGRLERRVDGALDGGRAAIAPGQVEQRGAPRDEPLLDGFVERHVGATEAVDGLLGVADQEELAGHGGCPRPCVLRGILGREQEEDLGLERVGVLELVDEDALEAALEVLPRAAVGLDEIAGAEEQVEEIELAGARLPLLVRGHHGAQIVVEAGGEVRVAPREGGVEPDAHGVTQRRGLGAQPRAARGATAQAPGPLARAGERGELGLEAVVIARAHQLAPGHLFGEAAHFGERLGEVFVARRVGLGAERAEREEIGHEAVDDGVAIERVATPGSGEVPVAAELPRGLAQGLPGAQAVAPARAAAEDAAHPLRRGAERLLEPGVEAVLEEPLGLLLGHDLEEWVDARLDRKLPEHVGAERVDGADARHLEVPERAIEVLPNGGRDAALVARPLEAGAEAELHLAGGLLGERHGDDAVEVREPGAQDRDDAVHQHGGLAGAGRCLDEEGGPEVLADASARGVVGRRGFEGLGGGGGHRRQGAAS